LLAEGKFYNEQAQKLVALLYWDRGSKLHDTAELLVGQADHG
jgi:hypothetical protein